MLYGFYDASRFQASIVGLPGGEYADPISQSVFYYHSHIGHVPAINMAAVFASFIYLPLTMKVDTMSTLYTTSPLEVLLPDGHSILGQGPCWRRCLRAVIVS